MKNLEEIITILNDGFNSDPDAFHALICNRVPCNKNLADHPTIQVQQNNIIDNTSGESFCVGLLGILNGVIQPIFNDCICIKFTEKDENGRSKILGFDKYSKYKQ